jgi:DNA end-binding protein Ku
MARALWKGSISFGLVNVPIMLYPGVARAEEIQFTLLDSEDLRPIHYQRVTDDGRAVGWDDIVKGYEYADGNYVVLTDEDLARANVKATQTVDIIDFVKADEIAPFYYDTPYHLAPQKAGMKGYALLRDALARTGYVGIAKIVIRTRQRLAALIPRGRLLVLEVLRYEYELREPVQDELPGDDPEELGITAREVEMAESLLAAMAEPWDPARYKDTYHDDLLAMIKEKAAGKMPEEPPKPEVRAAKVIDIMPLLKQSLEEAKKGRPQAKSGRRGKSRAG